MLKCNVLHILIPVNLFSQNSRLKNSRRDSFFVNYSNSNLFKNKNLQMGFIGDKWTGGVIRGHMGSPSLLIIFWIACEDPSWNNTY